VVATWTVRPAYGLAPDARMGVLACPHALVRVAFIPGPMKRATMTDAELLRAAIEQHAAEASCGCAAGLRAELGLDYA
jgi:hypothetical protein